MVDFTYQQDENNPLYVHWVVVAVIVLLVILVCCWGWGPAGLRRSLGYEGFHGNYRPLGISSSGAKQLNTWAVEPGSTALTSLSPTSSNQRYLDQSQVNFQPSVSDQTAVDGVVAVRGDSPWGKLGGGVTEMPAATFLGGPQAPLFSQPPAAPGMTGHAYMKAVADAQQAIQAGLGKSGAEAAVAAESYSGGYEGAKGAPGDPLVFSSFGSSGFSDQELGALL